MLMKMVNNFLNRNKCIIKVDDIYIYTYTYINKKIN